MAWRLLQLLGFWLLPQSALKKSELLKGKNSNIIAKSGVILVSLFYPQTSTVGHRSKDQAFRL